MRFFVGIYVGVVCMNLQVKVLFYMLVAIHLICPTYDKILYFTLKSTNKYLNYSYIQIINCGLCYLILVCFYYFLLMLFWPKFSNLANYSKIKFKRINCKKIILNLFAHFENLLKFEKEFRYRSRR